MKIKVLTGVLSVGVLSLGLLAVVLGNDFTADNVEQQETQANQEDEYKYFTNTEARNGKTLYEYEDGNMEVSSDFAITEEGIEQIKIGDGSDDSDENK